MKSLHCYEPSQHQSKFVPLLLRLCPREVAEEGDGGDLRVHLHGSLILQEILAFNKPIKVVNSLLGMPPKELKTVLSDPRGSHVTDAFMSSPTIGEKSREAVVRALKVIDESSAFTSDMISIFFNYLFRGNCWHCPVASTALAPWTPSGARGPLG